MPGPLRSYGMVIEVTLDDLDDFTCGKSRSIATLVEHARAHGAEVIAVDPPRRPLRWLVRALCFAISAFDRPLGKILRQYLYAAPFVRRPLAEAVARAEATGRPYVVHARDFRSLLVYRKVARSSGLGHAMLTVHSLGSVGRELVEEGHLRAGSRFESWVHADERRALELAELVVVASGPSRDALLAAFPEMDPARVVVVPNPVEVEAPRGRVTRESLGLAEDDFVVLAASRLKHVKRLDLLLQAVAVARRSVPRLKLLVAGDGYESRSLRHLVHRSGLEDAVTLLGARRDVPELIALSDVVALTSSRESFGRILAEGALLGRPLAAFDVGGVRETVVDGENGYLVPFGDVEVFAGRLARLAGDPELRRRMGESSREVARRFSPERVTARYVALFDELCDSDAPAR